MRSDRTPRGEIRAFLTTPSRERDRIADYVRDKLGDGTRSVALCFRGNAATLYYRCHQLLRLRAARSGIVGEFDFRHARFSENYRETLKKLKALHVAADNFAAGADEYERNIIRFALAETNADELTEILETYRTLIDDFFDPEKTEYAFGAPSFKREKSSYLEKDRQQQLWAAYFQNRSLTYYDLEYSERYAQRSGLHGRFDLLGLRAESDRYTLLLTELKSTPQAVYGKSGITDHERDYLAYLDSPFVAVRKSEACETIKLLCEIFRTPCPQDLTPQNIVNAKVKFVFSDTVIDAGKNYRPSDERIEKTYLQDGVEKHY